jgi:hypothetical protein
MTGDDRPRMRLLGWERIDKGALIGRAHIRLPSGLEIADVGIFQKDGRRWAQLPAEAMRDRTGELLKDERGKTRYRSALKWQTRDLQERFSFALIELIEAERGAFDQDRAA